MGTETKEDYEPRTFPDNYHVYYRLFVPREGAADRDGLTNVLDFCDVTRMYRDLLDIDAVEAVFVETEAFEVDGIKYYPTQANMNAMRFYNWRGEGRDLESPYHYTADCRRCGKDMVIDDSLWISHSIIDCVCQHEAWLRYHSS